MSLTQDYTKTLYEWLSGFAETFREPILFDLDNPQPNEYIAYSAVTGNFGQQFLQPITIYSKSTSYKYVWQITDAIEAAIGEKGLNLKNEWGYITIYKGSPFYQDKTDEDDSIRAGYINLLLTIYQFKV